MSSHRYASVVRLTDDDPVNDLEVGDELIIPGRCEDGVSHTVMDREQQEFVSVGCEVIKRYDYGKQVDDKALKSWAAEQANDDDELWDDSEEATA